MKIISITPILDIAGKTIKTPEGKVFSVGTALSNILLDAKEGGKMKLFQLAQKFYNEEDIEVDTSDLILIKQAVQSTGQYTNLVCGQIELLLENIKEENAKPSIPTK